MYAANAGRRLATSCVLLGGSLEYAKSGGRSAVARCAPAEEKEPPKEEEQEEEEGLERYLGYSAALARLKLVMLRAKTALATELYVRTVPPSGWNSALILDALAKAAQLNHLAIYSRLVYHLRLFGLLILVDVWY